MVQTKSRKWTAAVVTAVIWLSLVGVPPVFGGPSQAKIAVLTPGLTFTPVLKGLQEGLARLGYKEGRNITFIVEDTQGSTADLPHRTARLLAAKPDLLFTVATVYSIAVKRATATVPIVFAWVGDPVEAGLIAGFASSKNNLTGVSSSTAPLSGKRLEILLEVAPKIKRVLTIVTPNDNIALSSFRFLEETAKKLGVQLVRRDVTSREGIELALRDISKRSVDAIYYLPAVLMLSNIDLLVNKSKAEKIPLVVLDDAMVNVGALISYGPEPHLIGLQAAGIVDKVLKGTRPSDIVVESPDKLFLAINLTTAKEIGLKISRAILERADRLIE